jgi:manganese/zinc/iron transport system substrate-binding protein
MRNFVIMALAALTLACTPEPSIDVLCTTSVVADAARQLLPEEISVQALMQSNIDPHSYKPVESDVAKLSNAGVILHNGLHLEGKMTDILEKVGQQKPVYAMSSALQSHDLIEVGPNTYDPHIWFDLQLWNRCVGELALFLKGEFPQHSAAIESNAMDYFSELVAAHDEFVLAINEVPDSVRALVTAHDAFSYFGRAYGIEVHGLQGISTACRIWHKRHDFFRPIHFRPQPIYRLYRDFGKFKKYRSTARSSRTKRRKSADWCAIV